MMLVEYCLTDSRAGDKACVKDKMIYAASKAGLKDVLGADIAIQASDEDDLSLSEIYEKWVYKILVLYELSFIVVIILYMITCYSIALCFYGFTIDELRIYVHFEYFIYSFRVFVE